MTKVVFEIEAADLEEAQKKARRWVAYGDHHGLEISHRHMTAEPPASFTKPNGDRGKKFKFVAWVNAEQNDKRLLRMLENVDSDLTVISPKLPAVAALSMSLGLAALKEKGTDLSGYSPGVVRTAATNIGRRRLRELGLAEPDESPVFEMSLAREAELGIAEPVQPQDQPMTADRRRELGI